MSGIFYNEYPYTDMHQLNLSWIISQIKTLTTTVDEFVSLNTIKYADPIQWDITTQYEENTVVIDPQTGDAYISVQEVPSGVALSNSDYWTIIFNYSDELNTLREQIAAANEETSTTATSARAIGDLVWLNGQLAEVIATMIAGDSYVEGSNFNYITIETFAKEIYYPDLELVASHCYVEGAGVVITGDQHVYDDDTETIIIYEEV